MSLREEVKKAVQEAGGGFGTRKARGQILGQFCDFMKERNYQVRHLADVKEKHVREWISAGQANGITARVSQNRLSAIRRTLEGAGLDKKAALLTTDKFEGVGKAPRDPARVSMTREEYQARLEQVRDTGARLVCELQRELGLRQMEGIRAGNLDTLQRWQRELRERSSINVILGAKNGKHRVTLVFDTKRAGDVVDRAIKHLESRAQQGMRFPQLIEAPNLKTAEDKFNNATRHAFFGDHSPHSLRYCFAQDSFDRYRTGMSEREALTAVSHDLGHGDDRGTWVKQIYLNRAP